MRLFYVYVCFRTDGSPCYVGKGKGNRAATSYKKTKNVYLRRIVSRCGGELPTVIIRSGLAEAEAFAIERAFIAAIGRRDLGLGPLANRTDGGEGLSGHRFSKTTKKLLSKLTRARMAKLSREERVAMATNAARALPPEERSANARARWAGRSPEERQTILAPSHRSPKRSLNQKARWEGRSPEERFSILGNAFAGVSPEMRVVNGRKGAAALTFEQRSAAGRRSNVNMSPEQRRARAIKGAATRRAAKESPLL